MIGEKILGYTVDEKIGSGGFGTVYKVSKTNASGTYVRALKHITIPSRKQYADVLNSMGGDYSKADDYFAGVLREIVNEIQIISTLSESGTQNIVRYYENDIVESESPKKYEIYILMECLTPFTDYLYQNELKVKDVIKLGKDILTALISCHDKNIIHRDIKDDNIFVSADGSYKLGDFGVSKVLKDRSRAESMKGTPNFIAPEVYLGKEQYDNTVDVYSLGIVLYKLLNKSRNPFLPEFPQAYNSNDEDVAFEKRMKGEVPNLPFDAQNTLGEAIIKAISKRELRYNSAKDFLDAIMEAEQQLTEEELDKAVNQVIAQPQKEEKNMNSVINETIGIDMGASLSKSKEDRTEHNLFETVSDTYDKMPEKVEPDVSVKTEPVVEQPKVKPESVEANYGYSCTEPVQVAAIDKSDFKWVAYLLPVVFLVVFVLLYLIILPLACGIEVGVGNWLFGSPEKILDALRDKDVASVSVATIWALKIFMYILGIGFVTALFYLGVKIMNMKPAYNTKAVVRDKDAYYKAMDLYESIKAAKSADAHEAKLAVRNIVERLRNESDFGIGNDYVTEYETDIIKCLQNIEDNVQAILNNETAKEAGEAVVENCRTIQSKLKLRAKVKNRN